VQPEAEWQYSVKKDRDMIKKTADTASFNVIPKRKHKDFTKPD
jgi:hypothetical protein